MKRRYILLACIIIFVIILQMIVFYDNSYYFTPDSYYHLRHIEFISQHGYPLFSDPLSNQGQFFPFMPLYHYIIAFMLFISNITIVNLLHILLVSFIVPAAYLISSSTLKNRKLSIVVVAILMSIPILSTHLVNTLDPLVLFIPIYLLLVYAFMELENSKQHLTLLLIGTIILTTISSHIIIMSIGFLISLLLFYAFDQKIHSLYKEYMVFSLLFILWSHLILYKKIILSSLTVQFNYNVISLLQIGIISFSIAIYASYQYIFVKKSRKMTIIIGQFLSFLVAVLLGADAQIILSILSVLCMGQILRDAYNYLQTTRLVRYSKLVSTICVLFIFLQIIPLFFLETPVPDRSSLVWIDENISTDATIIAPLSYGHYITYFAKRKNLADSTTFNDDEFADDIKKIYTSVFKIEVIRQLKKYDSHYILFNDYIANQYNIIAPKSLDNDCFIKIYEETSTLYRWNEEICTIEE